MAKSANLGKMNTLHDKLAGIFTKVLEGYGKRLDAMDELDMDDVESQMVEALSAEPSPAMLSAISKFLKDNDISYDDGAVEGLSAVERQLENRKKVRGNITTLTNLRAVDNG